MKLLAFFAIALGLMSASPAEARHHHRYAWQAQHSTVPMPKPRLITESEVVLSALQSTYEAVGTQQYDTRPRSASLLAGAATDDRLPQHVVLIRLYEYGLQRLATDAFYRR
jgi:hypothetical protein